MGQRNKKHRSSGPGRAKPIGPVYALARAEEIATPTRETLHRAAKINKYGEEIEPAVMHLVFNSGKGGRFKAALLALNSCGIALPQVEGVVDLRPGLRRPATYRQDGRIDFAGQSDPNVKSPVWGLMREPGQILILGGNLVKMAQQNGQAPFSLEANAWDIAQVGRHQPGQLLGPAAGLMIPNGQVPVR